MKHVGVLIDFTDLCHTSVAFAESIAFKEKCLLSLIHVAPEKHSNHDVTPRFDMYADSLKTKGIDYKVELHYGKFTSVVPGIVGELDLDLVVIGTHGVHDVKQFLFGSNILSLTQQLPVPALVVQKESVIPEDGSTEILFPMAPHNDFIKKVQDTARLSKLFNSTVLLYTVLKSDEGPGEAIERNQAIAVEEFTKLGVPFEVVNEEATEYSFGYGKQIMKFAKERPVQFISIMSLVSDKAILGNADKERIILNDNAIPVFCVNK
ncbi:MAG: universal stress protein [Flavobacteriales bacterium]|nr:universal stress protein [Flavobacteriales bacterium]